jgi:hypothetical protein
MNIYELLQQSKNRHSRALRIIDALGIMEKWANYGSPHLLGAVSMNLVWNRDIDMNIYTPSPEIKHGFGVMGEIAAMPGVKSVEFHNFMDTPDQGYYWKISYLDEDGDLWKIDNWHVAENHPDAMVGENLSSRINEIITEDQRTAIIRLKHLTEDLSGIRGIDIYRAVMEGEIEDRTALLQWLEENRNEGMMLWMP